MYFKPQTLNIVLFCVLFFSYNITFSQTTIHLADFESSFDGWTQGSGDNFDWTRDSGGTPSSGTGPSTGASGSYYMYTEASGNNNKFAYFVSPSFDLIGVTNPSFVFYYHMYGANMGTLDVQISTDGGATYPTTLWSKTGQQQTSSSAAWSQATINLTPYIGQTVYIRFKGTTGNGYRSDMAIDNISLTVTYSSREINVTGNGTNIPDGNTTIATTDNTDLGSVYYLNGTITKTFTIENIGTTDLDVSSITSSNALFTISNITLPTTITSSNFVTFDVTFDPSTISTQTSTITINNNDSNENPYTFNVQGQGVDYCTSNGSTSYNTGVSLVSFNTINNSDTNNQNTGYEDFTAISTSVIQGSSYNLTVNVDTDGNYTVYSFVWIDWNQDGDFDDAGETYDLGNATNVPNGATSSSPLSITVPATATLGSTRMRVSARYYTNPTSCGTGFDGEVEDYTVNVILPNVKEINVSGNTVSIVDGDTTPSTTDNTDFRSVGTGSSTADRTFTIKNLGNSTTTLNLTGTPIVAISGSTAFTVVTQPSASSIIGGNLLTFVVRFTPTANGTVTANISIANDDSDENPYNFTIQGTGVTPLTAGPGGVKNDLQLWLKATKGLSYTNGQSVSLWADQARGSDATAPSGLEPTYRDNATDNVNFNPVVNFANDYNTASEDYTNSDTSRQVLLGTSGFYSQDIFLVVIPNVTVNSSLPSMDVFCGDADPANDEKDGTGIGFGKYSVRFDNEILSSAIGTSPDPSPANVNDRGYGIAHSSIATTYSTAGIINSSNNSNTPTGNILLFNGTNVGNTEVGLNNFSNVNNSRFWLGRSEAFKGSFDGRIAEVISYSARKNDANLTDERNKIQSYLAIKYGITLGVNGTSQDYVDSAGTIIWDIDTGVPTEDAFNYNITGIGRDDTSELNQKQSKTVNTVDDITIGLTDIYTTNNLNTNSFLADKDFLVLGNDNGDLSASTTTIVDMSSGIVPSITPDGTKVEFQSFNRKWKLKESGTIGKVKISIPSSMLTPSLPTPGDYLMFISDTPTFSPTSEYRVMTANGTDLETTYDFNGTKYLTFGYAPEKTFVRSIQFDGIQDYLDAGDVLDLNSTAFTISAWIKRNNTNASIVSKRDSGYTTGYNFGINASGRLEMSWNGGSEIITSSIVIPTNIWHQVAVIFDGTDAKLYIDGVEDVTQTTALNTPVTNTESFLIAAADGNELNTTSFFDGNIDEVRIWDVALTQDQLRFVMNQEIVDNTNVDGSYFSSLGITPTKNDINTIPWANLKGYYPMSTYTFTNCKDNSGNGNIAALKNLTTVDYQTAPLPYLSDNNGTWDTPATWLNNTVQNLPNSLSIVDGVTRIDWNIVEISDNNSINSGANRDITILGLNMISNTADGTDTQLTINGDTATGTGNGLTITHYLKLDGVLDLQGESQLIQTIGSDLDAASTGYLERDQQGTENSFRYNYWSSPVNSAGTKYTIGGVLRDGTDPNNIKTIDFGASYTYADVAITSPIKLSAYWMFVLRNSGLGYSAWFQVGNTGEVLVGEGYTMKGSNTNLAEQNYTFVGKPNNGDFTLPIIANNDYLIGNPYASAIDANQFIDDNTDTTGTIYFWEHYGGDSHNLIDYQGGYATYSKAGGVSASSNPPVAGVSTSGSSVKIPGRYIPVAQAFFAVGNPIGGNIKFNNGQRIFVKEASAVSVFMKSSTSKSKIVTTNKTDLRPKFRIGFEAPKINHRQLLLTIDKNTSDAVDWGYDAEIYTIISNDIYWIINDKKYVIQATNTLTLDKEIPLGIETKEGGTIRIMVDALENIDENTSIYIKDNLTDETYNITNQTFEINLEAGEYKDRFVLAFQPRLKTLKEVNLIEGVHVFMNNKISELQLNKIVDTEIVNVSLYNYLGQQVKTWDINTDDRFISLPIQIATGVYITQIHTTSGILTKKIIIE